jgi:type VI secretion system protein ImpF
MNETRGNSQASILDRLIDLDPDVSKEPVQLRLRDPREAKASVVRDLENLLNTRRHILTPPPGYTEVNSSLFTFGLPDFTSQNPKNITVRQQLRQEIERTIARFEPRLRNVSVHVEAAGDNDRSLRFRINGLLMLEPEAEPVTFDTYFDVNRSQYVFVR